MGISLNEAMIRRKATKAGIVKVKALAVGPMGGLGTLHAVWDPNFRGTSALQKSKCISIKIWFGE